MGLCVRVCSQLAGTCNVCVALSLTPTYGKTTPSCWCQKLQKKKKAEMIIQVAHLNPVPGHIGYDKTLEWRGEGCSPRGLWGQRLLDRPTISMYCTPSSWRFGTFCLDCRGSTWFVSSVRLSGRTAWLWRSMWSNKSATASGGQRSTSLPPWSQHTASCFSP